MTAITRPWQWLTNHKITAARTDQDHDAILFAQDQPGCIVRRGATQPITASTFTDVTFPTEVVDPYNMFTATSADINILYDGYYLVLAGLEWATTSRTGTRHQKITLNNVEIDGAYAESPCGATGRVVYSFGNGVPCVTGDKIRLNVWQDSASNPLNILNARLAVVRAFGPGV